MKINTIFPILDSLADYSGRKLRADLIAGLTVAILLIPQGMAYAFLAGMPPIYGLYAALVPLILYALLGSSRQMSIGPVAVSALLVLAGVSQLAEPGTEKYISLVITTGLLIGIVQILLSVLKMGFLVNFLSHPVVAGFTSAAAVIIAVSQLKDVFGFPIPRFSQSHQTVAYAVEHIGEINWVAFGICIGTLMLISLLRRIKRSLPGALIAVVLTILISWLIGPENYDLAIVGKVPVGMPAFQLPELSVSTVQILWPTVLTVTIIGVVESIGIAKVLEARHQTYIVRPNQELLALGVSKLGGAFFQALPSSGSFTRSALNNDAGARSGIASVVTAVFVGLTLLFFTPLIYFLPKAVLAAIILLAVKSLFDYKEFVHLWRTHRQDFVMMMVTFIATLALGIDEGVLVGVLLSVFIVLYRSSRPHVAILGKMPGTTYYRNVDRFEEVKQQNDELIIRFDNQLYFGNASYFKETIRELVSEKEPELKSVFLDAKSIHAIDSTGLHALEEIYEMLRRKRIHFYISGAIGPVRDSLGKSGFIDKMGKDKHFIYLHDALEYHSEQRKE